MKRFAQKSKEPSDEMLRKIGQEGLSQFEYDQQVEKYKESEKKMIQFCQDLKEVGFEIRSATSKIPTDAFLAPAKAGLVALSNKLIETGDDAIAAIKLKNDTIFGLGVGSMLTSTYQPSAKIKTPSFKRFIPFIGDVVNFTYTLNLKPSDFTDAIKIIFTPYKCSGDHPNTKAPLLSSPTNPNFKDHPELEEQHRDKFTSFSSLALNIGTLLQNVEAALAIIATFTGQFEFVAAIRAAGGIVQTALSALSILFSPNTYDILAYGLEDYKGQGIDKTNPLSILNITGYPQLYEAKPIAEEAASASARRVQNFILLEIYPANGKKVAMLKDNLDNFKVLAVGDKWPKWNITLTGIFRDHVEYKDSSGKIYSVRGNVPSYATPEKSIYDQKGTAFLNIMKDVANLPNSGVKGDVNKLMAKKMSDIMSLVFQLKNKYPWIGDSKNAKWINLQSDILSHVIREPKKRKPTPKPVATTPMIKPLNKSRTPGTTDLDREMKRREDLPPL